MPERPQINLPELFNLAQERLSQNINLRSDSFGRTKDLLYILAKWQRLRFCEIEDKALRYCYLAKMKNSPLARAGVQRARRSAQLPSSRPAHGQTGSLP